MADLKSALGSLPDGGGAVVVLSGGLDSTVAMRLCVEKYGRENVRALTFYYGQRQSIEIDKARASTSLLGVRHKVLDLRILGDIGKGFSANLDSSIAMPTIHEVLGSPQPKTYVPNRNMILASITAAYAEVEKMENIVMGLQVHDEYGYWDTTQRFVDKLNSVLSENRLMKPRIIAPFSQLSKLDEICILEELDKGVGLLAHTLTCYNPDSEGHSCGKCPSCSERIMNFAKAGIPDMIKYQIDIDWNKLIERYKGAA
jgi:7-cyano-7-deazaguanine synthase